MFNIAKLNSDSKVENDKPFYYKVTLTATTSQRYVHVIANGPESLEFNKYDRDIIPELTTAAGEGAYWTMFSLPNGTSKKDANGNDQPSEVAQAAFSNLKLIRNFAKVNITSTVDESKFKLLGYKVFNTPDKGRIATWWDGYTAPGNDRLNGYYTPYVGEKGVAPMTFSAIQDAGYAPSLAADASIDMTAPTAEMDYKAEPQFVFERVATNGANRPYIILKGLFNGSTTPTFYRLDFTDKDGNYLPIYRNFLYDLVISSVAKVGVSDPATAQPSNANVSALLTTQNLTDLADGTSRIFVQYLDKTFLNEGTVNFQYLYLPDATKEISQANVKAATFKILTDAECEAVGKAKNTAEPAFTSTGATTWNASDKWQEIELNIAASGETEKRTTFRITGETADGDKLYRDITIHVLAKQDFNASYTSSGSAIGSLVTVKVTLPDNLPSSVFPLEIAFEDSNKRLNPANLTKQDADGNDYVNLDMPARVGTSIIPNVSNKSYQFVKSVSYADYTDNHVIDCEFKRIQTGATTLYMENEYFNKPYSITIAAN